MIVADDLNKFCICPTGKIGMILELRANDRKVETARVFHKNDGMGIPHGYAGHVPFTPCRINGMLYARLIVIVRRSGFRHDRDTLAGKFRLSHIHTNK